MKYTKKHSKKKPLKYNFSKKHRNIKEIIEKRYVVLIVIIFIAFAIIAINLFYIQIIKKNFYVERVSYLSKTIVSGTTAPRGRIYDRKHRLIVDNKPLKVIYYQKEKGVTIKEEIELAYKVSDLIEIDYSNLSEMNLKKFWVLNNSSVAKSRITDLEWQQLNERKITLDDIENWKIERVTEEDLNDYQEIDKKAATIYFLMNKGYSYAEKIIKKDDVTDIEYARIAENAHQLNGFNTRLDWERVYPYGEVFKSILGSVSTSEAGLPYELKDYYLSKGYTLNDRVGISYLEYQYENYLRGTKNKYEIIDNSYNLIEEGKRGNDIVLTIDIEVQKAVEEIIKDELIKTKNEPNTEYFDKSFVIITDPKTGEVIAMAGKQIIKENDNYVILDYTPGVATSAVVAGSVVKGASHIAAYNEGALSIGEVRDDFCIKIASTPQKCSWTTHLGRINDIEALRQSSNSYQYQSAIKIGKGVYIPNQPLSIDKKAFDTYRNTFAEFGLGVKTEIDLPVESLGYKGNSNMTGHLLDFAIGQYDTYTPIQLAQYIGVVANGGNRMKPYLLKEVYDSADNNLTHLIYKNEPTVLNKLNTKDEFLKRVQLGFKAVLTAGGTGYNYMPFDVNPAGKTGTSEGFIDTDLDGVVDKETYSNNFIGYAPFENPVAAFTIVTPDVSVKYGKSTYRTAVNRRISYEVVKKFFQIYQ